jgi:TubC N-terminal docking domain
MSSTSDQRVRALLQELQQLGVRLWLDERGAHAEPAERLTPELKGRLRDVKSEVIEYLAERGEEVVDYTAGDPEGKSHSDMRTLPRTPEEAERQRADAERTRESARRRYQGGAVLINDKNSFGHYMDLLVRARERREAVERGDLPPEGRYVTRFGVFK